MNLLRTNNLKPRLINKFRRASCHILALPFNRPKGYSDKGRITIFFDFEGRYAKPGCEEWEKRGIARILEVQNVTKFCFTFNVVGRLILDDSTIMREIIDRGNEIACHTYEHKSILQLSFREIIDDLQKCKEVCENKLNYTLKGFRSPRSQWNFQLIRALKKNNFLWNAEDDQAGFPYIIAYGRKNSIWRLPVRVGDYTLFETNRMEAASVVQHLNKIVEKVARDKTYAAIGFHPWVIGKEESRLMAFESFILGLKSRSDLAIVPFGAMIDHGGICY